MRFKYEHSIQHLENCPPSHYERREFVAYRFVFEDLHHKNNFLPVLMIKPKRINAPEFASGQIEKTDGVASPIDDNGHISLHEFDHTDLQSKWHVIAEAYPVKKN
jgi:hypothetical protein